MIIEDEFKNMKRASVDLWYSEIPPIVVSDSLFLPADGFGVPADDSVSRTRAHCRYYTNCVELQRVPRFKGSDSQLV